MNILYHALSIITLLSLFYLGPAFGRAMLMRVDKRQSWSQSIQHIALGLSTMIALTGMILIYGVVWKLSPRSVTWYAFIDEVTITGSVDVTGGTVDVQEPLRVQIDR
jgi:hypothetical protein